METLIVQPKNKETKTYDPDFVEKILQGREDIKNGKGIKVDPKDLWK
jgi:hypothetical protein